MKTSFWFWRILLRPGFQLEPGSERIDKILQLDENPYPVCVYKLPSWDISQGEKNCVMNLGSCVDSCNNSFASFHAEHLVEFIHMHDDCVFVC